MYQPDGVMLSRGSSDRSRPCSWGVMSSATDRCSPSVWWVTALGRSSRALVMVLPSGAVAWT